jgi:hypothetical protein
MMPLDTVDRMRIKPAERLFAWLSRSTKIVAMTAHIEPSIADSALIRA